MPMRSEPVGAGLRLSVAAGLTLAGIALAWLCVRTALVAASATIGATPLVADRPEIVLGDAADALVRRHGILDPATLAAVRRAAAAAPLDARAYLVLGHQQLLDDQPGRALLTLEAGERLDPRQRVIHLLLLDRYLRTGRPAEAAKQFAVLSRLVGVARGPIALAMAKMSLDPGTGAAVRRTLGTDPALEQQVLVALARTQTPPQAIFALASPVALANAASAGSWGPALIERLVEQRQYAEARSAWRRIYRLPESEVEARVVDASFQRAPTAPPFDWTLVAGSIGAADIRNGALAIDYYGRDSGPLASQLLVLAPGRYRFAFTVEPGKTDANARLGWSIACVGHARDANGAAPAADERPLVSIAVTAAPARRRAMADFTVPAGCPAQRLQLAGEAGEFPAPTDVTLDDVAIDPAPAAAPSAAVRTGEARAETSRPARAPA